MTHPDKSENTNKASRRAGQVSALLAAAVRTAAIFVFAAAACFAPATFGTSDAGGSRPFFISAAFAVEDGADDSGDELVAPAPAAKKKKKPNEIVVVRVRRNGSEKVALPAPEKPEEPAGTSTPPPPAPARQTKAHGLLLVKVRNDGPEMMTAEAPLDEEAFYEEPAALPSRAVKTSPPGSVPGKAAPAEKKAAPKKAQAAPKISRISDIASSSRVTPASRPEADDDYSLQKPTDTALHWGGIFNYNGYRFYNEDRSDQTVDAPTGASLPDFRYWASKNLGSGDSVYARLRYARMDLSGDSSLTEPNSLNIGPKVDLAYYNFCRRPDLNFRVGRQYLKAGRGIAYSGDLDGFYACRASGDLSLSGFAGRTEPREINNDQSNSGYLDRSYRDFYSMEARYSGISGHKLYGFLLSERDGNVRMPYSAKEFAYNANYLGFGAEGDLRPNFPYYVEGVVQTGSSASTDALTGRESVNAAAYDIGADYYFETNPRKPYLTIEYSHAGGDPDRKSVTDTIGGNLSGTPDNNFMPFGEYELGLGLHPKFSNINVFSFGGFIKPFYDSKRFREFQLGAKYFHYTKDNAQGGISDPVASGQSSGALGHAYDLYLTWRAYSDLLVYYNYGKFFPGAAYPSATRDAGALSNFGYMLFF